VPSTEQTAKQSIFVTGDLLIDYAQHLVTVRDKPVQLSRTEYKLLSVLAQNVGMVMTHELLLERVWDRSTTAMSISSGSISAVCAAK